MGKEVDKDKNLMVTKLYLVANIQMGKEMDSELGFMKMVLYLRDNI